MRKSKPNAGIYDEKQSIAVARTIEVLPGKCYRNAALALHTMPYQGARYVEGYIDYDFYGETEYLPHAWVELRDGTIIDPTRAALMAYGETWLKRTIKEKLLLVRMSELEYMKADCWYHMFARYSRTALRGIEYDRFPITKPSPYEQIKDMLLREIDEKLALEKVGTS